MTQRTRPATSRKKWSLLPALPVGDLLEPDAERSGRDTRLALGVLAVYVVMSVVYGLLADAPWDDDCVTRFFNTRNALAEPRFFFDLWSRPLFVLLFAFTAKLGTTAMMVQMVAINAAAGWLLFRAVQRLGLRAPWLVLMFYFFQTYYFSTSRNNLTEPLAASVICVGLYALVRERYLLFTLMGVLLPLARLELSVALAVWALVLVAERQARYIPLLASGIALLMVGGVLVKEHADALWLINETVSKDAQANRYGHQEFLHYFRRIAYVTGPATFYFLFIGLGTRLARLKLDLFVLVQAFVIFLLYVVFSWKLNMGNAAGFLRNLVPLAPLIAVLALQGVAAWLRVLEGGAVAEAAARKPAGRKDKAVADPDDQRVLVHVLSVVAVAIVFLFFSTLLVNHHKVSTTPSYTNLAIVGALALVLVLGGWYLRRRPEHRARLTGAALGLVSVTAFAYTVMTEPPDAHLNPERVAVGHLADLYKGSYLEEFPLYVNHSWFFWRTGLVDAPPKFQRVTRKHIEEAPVHALVLWEPHYARRLAGDVERTWVAGRKDLVELYHVATTDGLEVVLYQKVDTAVADDKVALGERFMAAFPKEPGAYIGRYMARSARGDHKGALADATTLQELDSASADGRRMHATALFNMGDNAAAIAEFEAVLRRFPKEMRSYYYIGSAYNRMKEPQKAIPALLRASMDNELNSMPELQEQLGVAYYNANDFSKAYGAFTAVIKLRPKAAQGYLQRCACSLRQNKPQVALKDVERAVQLEPRNGLAYYDRASIYEQLKQPDKKCENLRIAAQLGYAPAIALAPTCR